MYFLYNLLLSLAAVFLLPIFLIFALITGKYREGLGQRFGFISRNISNDPSFKPRIWIHACSVGEVNVISPIIEELKGVYPSSYIVVSNITKSGHDYAKKVLKGVSSHIYFPLDIWWIVGKALSIVTPDIILVAETEIWPNFLLKAKRSGIKTIMINGRISPISFESYMKVKPFMKRVLRNFDAMSMTLEDSARRIISMGALPEAVVVTGNSKYDGLADQVHPCFEKKMRAIMEISEEDKVFIAGSTRRGEEEVIIEVFLELIKTYPNILMIIAPRHIERTGELEKLLQQNNLEFVLKTALDKGSSREHKRVIIVNTIGDLSRVYSVGTIVFCGGSLVPLGGQNVLEAAAWGKVVLYGTSMENFVDAKELLEGVGAGIEVSGIDDLTETCLELLGCPERLRSLGEAGREAVMANRGAAGRNVLLIEKLLEGRL